MGWIKQRIEAEHRKHSKNLDWSAIAEAKIKAELKERIRDFEKKNNQVLKTEDIIKEKILISDYIKWNKFRELNDLLF